MVTANSDLALRTLLAGLLPTSPARLLLLGDCTDALVDELRARGYEVSNSAWCQPQGFAQFPSNTRQGIYQVDLALPHTETARFDAAVVCDVSPQVHPLALFEQLALCLVNDAVVVMLAKDEAGQSPPRVERWWDYLADIGSRCGFSAFKMGEGLSSNATSSRLGLFRKTAIPRWQLRHMRPSDFVEIAELFEEVFGHPMSRGLWEWKYANGHGNAVLASRDGVLIAHYGGMYREILLCGKPEWAYGGCDVMVHPKERGVMTRQGPFLLTAATTAEIYGPVAFGFPTERAMLVAEKMGLYSKAGQMAEVRWEAADPGFRLRTRVRALAPGSAEDEALVDDLWNEMANDLRESVVGVRDWKYIEYRYFGHPHNQYEVLVVVSRLTGKPLGVIVLRRLEGRCELLDVIAPLANVALVIDQARRMTARWGLAYLYCWITTNHASLFVACGGKEEALNVFIPTSCWTDDPRVNMLKGRWWLMSGDTDFR